MAGKSGDDSGLMNQIMNRIKGSRESLPNKTDPSQRKVRFSIWYFIAAMLVLTWVQGHLGSRQSEKVTYSDFKQWVREGKVENLVVGPETISGSVKDEKGAVRPFVSVRVEDSDLVRELQEKGIKFSGYIDNKWIALLISWLLPLAIFGFIWFFMMKRMSGSEFVEMFVGVGAARIRDLFKQAKEHAPCIIFLDEMDALGKARGLNPMGGHDEREQTLNQLLVEMDGFDPRAGVIILAATNRPDILDPALLRPGRFDRHVAIDKPDIRGREAILKVHAKDVALGPDVDLKKVAAMTPGFVGADLANLINEAALIAARGDAEEVTMANFREAAERIIGGLEKKNRAMNPKEKEIVAYHESGHALVAMLLPNTDPVSKVSIIPRGIAALGYTQQLPTEDRYLMTRDELLDRLQVLLGGRAAEEVIFGDISTGAQNDLQRASDIARSMVMEYGMSERLGLLTYTHQQSRYLNMGLGSGEREYSEKTAQEIDQEKSRIIEEAHQKVLLKLKSYRSSLEKLAGILLEKESIDGEELRRFAEEVRGQG